MNDLRIVFMGTPEFAVPSLEVLVTNGYNVVGVVTAPDKPRGRGLQLIPSPVKAAAEKHGLKVLQPTNLKSPEFQAELRGLNANLQIVVAFRMLPEAVWSMPALGTFNLHASLLPQYRGAAPINWAIIHGDKVTGITTFFLKHEIDTGSILFQESEPILDDDDAGSLYERLMAKGAGLVLKTVRAIEQNEYKAQPQTEYETLRHAPKLFRETCEIKWDNRGEDIRNFVRGLSPHPAAWSVLNGKVYKIYRGTPVKANNTATTGTIDTDNKTYLNVKVADGWFSILELQPEGKKRMKTEEFFRGNKI